jgi:hypothetical protein
MSNNTENKFIGNTKEDSKKNIPLVQESNTNNQNTNIVPKLNAMPEQTIEEKQFSNRKSFISKNRESSVHSSVVFIKVI